LITHQVENFRLFENQIYRQYAALSSVEPERSDRHSILKSAEKIQNDVVALYQPIAKGITRAVVNPHVQTLVASIPTSPKVRYVRETIPIPGRDFIDIDWKRGGSQRLVIVAHGLEGSSQSPYLRRLVRIFARSGVDVAAWNMRGCSGRPNNLPSNYHAGLSSDLDTVIRHVLALKRYEDITLVGYSLGGNLTLKYCAEQGGKIPTTISKVIALSVPCDLQDSAHTLLNSLGGMYNRYLVRLLARKASLKATTFPEYYQKFLSTPIRTIEDFDNVITAPHFGFRNALDYWLQCSCIDTLEDIRVPTWIITAKDDPFFSSKSIPTDQAASNPFLNLVIVPRGGHLGFFGNCRLHRWTDDYIASSIITSHDTAKLPLWISNPEVVG
jgi:predicted alpha/beta-fold hydrolase